MYVILCNKICSAQIKRMILNTEPKGLREITNTVTLAVALPATNANSEYYVSEKRNENAPAKMPFSGGKRSCLSKVVAFLPPMQSQ